MADTIAAGLSLNGQLTLGARYPIYGTVTYAQDVRPLRDCHSNGALPERSWQICTVETSTRAIQVANVHLTSGRFLTDAQAAESRVADLQSLLDASHDVDVICGDFNEGPRTAAQVLLESSGFVDAAIATGYEIASTGVDKPRSDQIWVRDNLADRITEFGATDWEPMAFDAPEKNVLSDHLPLRMTLAL